MKKVIKNSFILFYIFFLNNLAWAQDSYEEILKRADEKAAKQNYNGALVDYDLLVRKNPTETELRYKRGIALYQTFDYNKAIIDLSKATLDEQFAENAYFYRGRVRTDAKQYISALEDFGKVVRRNPQNIEVYRWRGRCKLQMGKMQKGLFDLEVFVEFSPKTWESYHFATRDILNSETLDTDLLHKAEEWVLLSEKLDKNTINQKTHAELEKRLGRKLKEKIPIPVIPKDTTTIARNTVKNKSNPSKNENFDDLNIETEFRKMQIWAVVVGVSDYQNPKIKDLQYANKDAQDYANFLRSVNGGSLDDEHLTVLTNEKATRGNVIKALRDKFNKAFDSDMVIFYIAGHGQPDPVGEEVFFLTHDADLDNLAGTALSQTDIEKIFSKTRARKKIWLADACHSGAAGLSKKIRGPENLLTNRLLENMANAEDGMGLLTASSASEFSLEDVRWGGGHGVFTHYLLEGLRGKANNNGKSNLVSIRELYEYVYRKVVADTNGEQHPELKGRFDNHFPMSVIK